MMVQSTEKNALIRSRGRLGYREHGFRLFLISYIYKFFIEPNEEYLADGLEVSNLTYEGLNISNLEKYGMGVVHFNIVNLSRRSGDVLFYIEQDGLQKCEHVLNIQVNEKIVNLKIPCSINANRYALKYAWSDSSRDMKNISLSANRIDRLQFVPTDFNRK